MKIIKNRKMKGTVLLTVVSVMALMIVFMTTTLVLANAANKRAHRSYSASQAEYTARAAIENFTEAMTRDPQIAAAVQSISITPGSPPVEANVTVNDPDGATLGHVGYYDSSGTWVSDRILIENVGKDYVRADLGSGVQWQEMDMVKISATARVGKEEKSVCAYIRKSPSSKNPDAAKVKGLNTSGDAQFPNGKVITGGLGIGLKQFKSGMYSMTNDITIDTTLSFINGGLRASTSTFHVDVNTDVSETIIMGDLWIKNDELVNLKYTPSGTYTQQNTPYLFVLGNLEVADKLNINATGGEKPYNIFAGTCTLNKNNNNIHADLYLTDPDSSKTSYVGYKDVGSQLYEWSDSLINSTTQFNSNGGAIYCRHNLVLASTEVRGDVRVDGNLTIIADPCDVRVHGDIVCGGTMTVQGPKLQIDAGHHIYCDSVSGTTPVTPEAFANFGGPAYPEKMRLENILGTINTTTGEVNPVAPPETKIIRTLDEVRQELHYNKTDGDFTGYAGSLDKLGGATLADDIGYNDSTRWITNASGTISDSCVITGFGGDVTIDSDASAGDMVIVLKGTQPGTFGYMAYDEPTDTVSYKSITSSKMITLNNKITVTGTKSVKFFIDGDLFLSNGQIVWANIPSSFDQTLKIPIDFYGAEITGTTVNSRILMQNNCLITGSFKMPWTDIMQSVEGPTQYTYTSDTGASYTGKPAIIGNALFHDILNTQNDFQMYYTEAGGPSGAGGFSTAIGHWDLAYYSGS